MSTARLPVTTCHQHLVSGHPPQSLRAGWTLLGLAAVLIPGFFGEGSVLAAADTTAPTAIILPGDDTVPGTFTAQVVFSEPVFGTPGLIVTKGSIIGGTWSTDHTTWTLQITPEISSLVQLALSAASVSDAAGNGNEPASRHWWHVPRVTIRGNAWVDVQSDGQRAWWEPPLTVAYPYLFDTSWGPFGYLVDYQVIHSDGTYRFETLGGGRMLQVAFFGYDRRVAPLGTGETGNHADATGLTPICATEHGRNFVRNLAVLPPAGTICGTIWWDMNADGVRTADEADLYPGTATVELLQGGSVVASTLSTDGTYTFSGLATDISYQVQVTLPPAALGNSLYLSPTNWSFSPTGQGSDAYLNNDIDPITHRSPSVTLNASADYAVVDAGCHADTAAIKLSLWWDLDRDGLRNDVGYPPSWVTNPWWPVGQVEDSAGSTLQGIYPDSDGTFVAEVPAGGSYRMVLYPWLAAVRATIPGGDSDLIDLADPNPVDSGNSYQRAATSLVSPTLGQLIRLTGGLVDRHGLIAGSLWLDANSDGLRQDDEPPATPVTVTLINGDTGWTVSTTTTSDGRYDFGVLNHANYHVSVATTSPDRHITRFEMAGDPTRNSDFGLHTADEAITRPVLLDGQHLQYDGGFLPTSAVGRLYGRVWVDDNGDGIQGSTEPGSNANSHLYVQVARDVTLPGEGTELPFMTRPRSDGWYVADVPPGAVHVQSNVPIPGHVGTLPHVGAEPDRDSDFFIAYDGSLQSDVVDLRSGSQRIDLGFRPESFGPTAGSVTVTGRVWIDLDRDGRHSSIANRYGIPVVHGPGDQPYPYAWIALRRLPDYDWTGDVEYYAQWIQSAPGDTFGNWSFTNVPAGTYDVLIFTEGLPTYTFTEYQVDGGSDRDSDVRPYLHPWYQYTGSQVGRTGPFTVGHGTIRADAGLQSTTADPLKGQVWIEVTPDGERLDYESAGGLPGTMIIQAVNAQNAVVAEQTVNATTPTYDFSGTNGISFLRTRLPDGYQTVRSHVGNPTRDSDFEPATLAQLPPYSGDTSRWVVLPWPSTRVGPYDLGILPIPVTDSVYVWGTTWNDLNSDGRAGPEWGENTEPFLPGATLRITRLADGLISPEHAGETRTLVVDNHEPPYWSILWSKGFYRIDAIAPSGYVFSPVRPESLDNPSFYNAWNVNWAEVSRPDFATISKVVDSSSWNWGVVPAGNFALVPATPANLAIHPWLDQNRNAKLDDPAFPIPLVDATLRRFDTNSQLGPIIATASATIGGLAFPAQDPGVFQIVVTMPVGEYLAVPHVVGNDQRFTAQVAGDQLVLTSDPIAAFGGAQDVFCGVQLSPSLITGMAWNDLGVDGIRTDAESGVPGVVFDLVAENGETLASTTSDANGRYRFDNIDPLGALGAVRYAKIRMHIPSNRYLSLPSQGADARRDSDFTFGSQFAGPAAESGWFPLGVGGWEFDAGLYATTGAVAGQLWVDRNQDGLHDADETDLPPFALQPGSVTLVAVDGTTGTYSILCAADGRFTIDGLQAGAYQLQVHQERQWQILPESGSTTYTTIGSQIAQSAPFVVQPGLAHHLDVGYRYSCPVTIRAFNDRNGNGIREPGDDFDSSTLTMAWIYNVDETGAPVPGSSFWMYILLADGWYRGVFSPTISIWEPVNLSEFNEGFQFDLPPARYLINVIGTYPLILSPNHQGSDPLNDSDFRMWSESSGYLYPFPLIAHGDGPLTFDAGLSTPQPGSITGTVWHDVNLDGVRQDQEGEPWSCPFDHVALLPMNYYGQPTGKPAINVPVIDGVFRAVDLPHGRYCVQVEQNGIWQVTPSEAGDDRTRDCDVFGVDQALAKSNIITVQGDIHQVDIGFRGTPNSVNGLVWLERLQPVEGFPGMLVFDTVRQTNEIGGWTFPFDAVFLDPVDQMGWSTGAASLTAAVDSRGQYAFTGLADGLYRVRVPTSQTWDLVADGYADTDVGNDCDIGDVSYLTPWRWDIGISGGIIAISGGNARTVDVGYADMRSRIRGRVWLDEDQDGQPRDGEGEGWICPFTVTLVEASYESPFTELNWAGAITVAVGVDGRFDFGLMPSAYYRLLVPISSGFTVTASIGDYAPYSTVVPVSATQARSRIAISSGYWNNQELWDGTGFNIGYIDQRGIVEGTIWRDVNRDGIRHDGEGAGWSYPFGPVELVPDDATIAASGVGIRTASVGVDGRYTFATVLPGTYRVRVAQNLADAVTTPGMGIDTTRDSDVQPEGLSLAHSAWFTVLANTTTIDAGYLDQRGTVQGRLWQDANRDGIRQDAEAAATAVTSVQLAAISTSVTGATIETVVATATANASGNYAFATVVPGRYRILATVPGTLDLARARAGTDLTRDSDLDPVQGAPARSAAFDVLANLIQIDGGFVPKGSLPFAWNTADVGGPKPTGSANWAWNTDTYTLTGGGAEIWGSTDQFRFSWQTLSGNGEIIARVASVQNTSGWARAGVMMRESLAANARNAAMIITPLKGAFFQRRTATGGTTASNNLTTVVPPRWVRLTRAGNTINAYHSVDGVTWTRLGSATTVTLGTTVYIGLVVTSRKDGTPCTAVFDHVQILPSGGG